MQLGLRGSFNKINKKNMLLYPLESLHRFSIIYEFIHSKEKINNNNKKKKSAAANICRLNIDMLKYFFLHFPEIQM